jgi:hypothetical protein
MNWPRDTPTARGWAQTVQHKSRRVATIGIVDVQGGKLMRVLKAVCCAAALTALLAPGARADEWNKKTFLTFSGPVQVPGATLPAGTYTFKLADLSGNRHVVQVFDKDEKKIFTTILAIPNQRLEPSDKPVVLFSERPAGSPTAVKVWYYPGETIGNEFVYPKTQAMAIAKASHTTVLSTSDETTNTERMKTPAASTTASAAPATTAPSRDAESKNSTGTAGRADTTPRSTTARHLPRTASNLSLFGLLSVLSLAVGLGLRRSRMRLTDAA